MMLCPELHDRSRWRAMVASGKKAESGILASVHKTVAGLHNAGLVDKAALREFEALASCRQEMIGN